MGVVGSVVILAAGQGTRMVSALPKVLHEVCGRPLLAYVLDQALALEPQRVHVVVAPGGRVEEKVRGLFGEDSRLEFPVQAEALGTGHALRQALPNLAPGATLVLYGDMPLIRPETLGALIEERESSGAGASLLTARPRDPRGFGRVKRDGGPDGVFQAIVEERDASPEERAIEEVNVGVYAFAPGVLEELLPSINSDNAQGEFYLTDLAGALVSSGREVRPLVVRDETEVIGVNTLAHLAEVRAGIQMRILGRLLAEGVHIEDPATTYVDWDVEVGAGTRILPCTVIRSGARIGRNCEVGPFTHLRPGTVLADGAEVGNFTETKNAVVGEGTKAKHLSYLGDVEIGAGVNIGAGTIVANYDGKEKHKTRIGARAFVGSGSILIAPMEVGEGAVTGGGAVVTRRSKVPPGETWVGVPARPLTGAKEERDSSAGGPR